MAATQVVVKYNVTLDKIENISCVTRNKGQIPYKNLADVPYENVEAKYIMLRMLPDGGSIKGVGTRGKPIMGQFWESDGTTRGARNYTMYIIEV